MFLYVRDFLQHMQKCIILIMRTFKCKYLYRMVHVTLTHHFVVFIPTFARSFINLFANDEFVLFGINGWPLFPYILSLTEAHRYRSNGNQSQN